MLIRVFDLLIHVIRLTHFTSKSAFLSQTVFNGRLLTSVRMNSCHFHSALNAIQFSLFFTFLVCLTYSMILLVDTFYIESIVQHKPSVKTLVSYFSTTSYQDLFVLPIQIVHEMTFSIHQTSYLLLRFLFTIASYYFFHFRHELLHLLSQFFFIHFLRKVLNQLFLFLFLFLVKILLWFFLFLLLVTVCLFLLFLDIGLEVTIHTIPHTILS